MARSTCTPNVKWLAYTYDEKWLAGVRFDEWRPLWITFIMIWAFQFGESNVPVGRQYCSVQCINNHSIHSCILTYPRFNQFLVYWHSIFTEFTDASMPPQTMLAWVSTGFRHIMPTITTDKLNFTASDSSSGERCFLKMLIVLQLTQLADSN